MSAQDQTGKRLSGGRILVIAVAVVLLLLIAAYFFLSSRAFVQSVVLPRVSGQVGAEVTAQVVAFRPFSELHLRNLRAQTPGHEPLLQADELHLRYNLWNLLRGRIEVDELTLAAPILQITRHPDGTSNLDPVRTQDEPSPGEPPRVDIRNLSITNGVMRLTVHPGGDAPPRVSELSELFLHVDRLKNDAPGSLEIRSLVRTDQGSAPGSPQNFLSGALEGRFDFTMDEALSPAALDGGVRFDVREAEGTLGDLAGVSAVLESDITPREVKTVALRFERDTAILGAIEARGPFSVEQMEGRLNVEITSIDRHALNLFGAPLGADFGTATINSTNLLELADGGDRVTVTGRFAASAIRVTHDDRITPELDIEADYDLRIDQRRELATVELLTIADLQNRRTILHGGLTRPMQIHWGAEAPAVDESTLTVVIDNLDLAEWRDFAGIESGLASGNLNLVSREAGQDLTLEFESRILGLNLGTTEPAATAEAVASGEIQIEQFGRARISNLRAALSDQREQMAALLVSGLYNIETGDADLNAELEANLPGVTRLLGDPAMTAGAGVLRFEGRLVQEADAREATGQLTLSDFTGRLQDYEFDRLGVSAETHIELRDNLLQLHRAAGRFEQAGEAGGEFEVSGRYDPENEIGNFQLDLANLNENVLGPFLQTLLGERRLVAVSLNGTAEARYDARRESFLKGEFNLSNLVVQDPQRPQPDPPLNAQFTLEAAIEAEQLDLRRMDLALSPTDRAANRVRLEGRLDLSDRDAVTGQLTLAADALDVTAFHDLYSPEEEIETPEGPPQTEEPDAVNLPVRQLVLAFDVERLYLRDIELAGARGAIEIENGRVAMQPIQPTLNGAPVSVAFDLDLGLPGYKYDFLFHAAGVPLEPLANTFIPEHRGQYQGLLIADVQLRGAGVTGPNLRRHLEGRFDLTLTNATLQLVSPRILQVLVPIATILRVEEITENPLNWIDLNTTISAGQIQVRRLAAQNNAFFARTQGDIPIADQPRQSPLQQLPFEFHLRRSLAERIRAVPRDAPPDADYVQLPNFIQIVGTLDDPRPRIDERALIGTAIDRAIQAVPGIDERVPEALRGIGDFLLGPRERPKPQPETPPEERR